MDHHLEGPFRASPFDHGQHVRFAWVALREAGPTDAKSLVANEIRAFIVPNVALSFTGGIVIGALDAGGVQFGSQITGLAGIHYYFFGGS